MNLFVPQLSVLLPPSVSGNNNGARAPRRERARKIRYCRNADCAKPIEQGHRRSLCKACYRIKDTARLTKRREDFPVDSMLAGIKSRTKPSKKNPNGIPFNLTREWFLVRLENGHCEVTGLPFKRPPRVNGKRGNIGPWTPSVDRIDCKKGYTQDNCQLVVYCYNAAKRDFPSAVVDILAVALSGRVKNKEEIERMLH